MSLVVWMHLLFVKVFSKTCALIPGKLQLVQQTSHTLLYNIICIYCSVISI